MDQPLDSCQNILLPADDRDSRGDGELVGEVMRFLLWLIKLLRRD